MAGSSRFGACLESWKSPARGGGVPQTAPRTSHAGRRVSGASLPLASILAPWLPYASEVSTEATRLHGRGVSSVCGLLVSFPANHPKKKKKTEAPKQTNKWDSPKKKQPERKKKKALLSDHRDANALRRGVHRALQSSQPAAAAHHLSRLAQRPQPGAGASFFGGLFFGLGWEPRVMRNLWCVLLAGVPPCSALVGIQTTFGGPPL